jgi:hypothetical protein
MGKHRNALRWLAGIGIGIGLLALPLWLAAAAPAGEESAQPAAGGYWELEKTDTVKNLQVIEGYTIDNKVEISNGSAMISEIWHACPSGPLETTYTWTPLPVILIPKQTISIAFEATRQGPPECPSTGAMWIGFYDTPSKDILADNQFTGSMPYDWYVRETISTLPDDHLVAGFMLTGPGGTGEFIYTYKWQPGAEPIQSTSTPEPTQAGPVTLEGLVTIEGANLPLGDVPIALFQDDQLIAQGITTAEGSYRFPLELVRPAKYLTLVVSLAEAATTPAAFQVIYEPDPDPVYAGTQDFEIPVGEEPTFRYDVAFGGTALVAGQTIPRNRLQDMGMVYYYTRQAYQEAVTYRKQTLDFAPALTVRANNPQFEALRAFWLGPNSLGGRAGKAPYIGLSASMSRTSQFLLAGGVIWHEFGHDVMADAYENMMPRDSTGTAHLGFFNPSTTDSWVEGFATFYALLVNRDSNPAADASVWYGGDYSVNLEVNYRSTYGYFGGATPASREEFGVASLLWDLVDPQDPEDCSPLMYNAKVGELFKITPAAPIADTNLTLYCDYMELGIQDLWTILTADASQIDPSPAAGNFAYIYDVKQLYHVLVSYGVGEHLTPNGISALNELFIAHGFFADTGPQNFTYDMGEAIGLTSNLAFRRENASFPARDIRRSPPPLVNSYLGVSVQDAQTGQAVEANDYEVTVRFDPPYELYNYSYIAPLSAPGQLYIEPPDSLYDATISVLPVRDGAPPSTQPVEFTTAQYWEWMGQDPSGSFLEHTFQVSTQGSSEVPSNEPATSETNNNGLIGITVLACCCLLILVIATAGGVLFFIRRSRSKSGRVSHRSG